MIIEATNQQRVPVVSSIHSMVCSAVASLTRVKTVGHMNWRSSCRLEPFVCVGSDSCELESCD